MEKLVSIIIPCYNQGDLLLETLESLKPIVDYNIHEVIIVNDGSTEERTNEIFDKLQSESNNYKIVIQENRGLSGARNTGIRKAQGKYILPLDSDNKLTDLYLTKGVDFLEKNLDFDVVYGESKTFDEEDGMLPTKEWHLNTILQYNYIDACALIRAKSIIDIGGYDEQMRMGWEDWDVWIRLSLANSKFHFFKNEIAQHYRVRKTSMLRSISFKKYEEIMAYLDQKYNGTISWKALDNYYFSKFEKAPMFWTLKLFIRKYLPKYYIKLVSKRKIKSLL